MDECLELCVYSLVDIEGFVTDYSASNETAIRGLGPNGAVLIKSDDDGEDNYGDLLLIRCINLGCVIRVPLQLRL